MNLCYGTARAYSRALNCVGRKAWKNLAKNEQPNFVLILQWWFIRSKIVGLRRAGLGPENRLQSDATW